MLPHGTTFKFSQLALRVKDHQKTLAFYEELLGFNVLQKSRSVITLSPAASETPCLVLHVDDQLEQPPRPVTGLYHVAFRLPDRPALGRLALRLIQSRYPLQGASDHHVSEALYLADPEGNGVELYVDRPRERWRTMNDSIAMTTQALDLRGLINAGLAEDPASDREEAAEDGQLAPSRQNGAANWQMPPGTDIGHVHLSVSDLQAAEAFYHYGLGLAVTARNYPGALFFAADGYHHHVGANIWRSSGADPAPEGSTGLADFTITVEPEAARQARAKLQKLGFTVTPTEEGFQTLDADANRINVTIWEG